MGRRIKRALWRTLTGAVLTACLGGSAFAQFTITLQPNTLPPATTGNAYNQVVTAVGGTAPYTFDYRAGSPSLPAGLSLASNGTISGTPSASGSVTIQIEATDNGGNTGFRTYTFNVGTAGGLGISPGSLPNGSQGVAYSQTVSGTGGTGPYTFSLGGGSLPAGLSLSSGGAITGTPTGSGPYNFTVNVLDSVGNTGSQAYTVNIGAAILTLNPASLTNGTLGTPYTATVTASGGTGPYTFSLSSGSLPTGLSLAANGNITGTPTVSGSYSFTVRAIDSVNNTGTRSYTVNIGSNILTVTPASPLPNGTRGQAYGATIGATGGTGPYTFAVTSGTLPGGLSLASNGSLTGTPSASGTFSFDVTATDTLFNTGTRSYSLTIDPAPLTINPTSLPNATTGTAYSQTIVASNGTAPYTYSLVSGTLPPGITLNGGSGALSGTPTTPGSYSFTIQATDAAPITGNRSYSMQVGANILTITPTSMPSGTLSSAYNQTVTASGGTGPYTYAVASGALPAGLTLNSSTGAITGTPTSSGAASFTIRATDSLANVGTQAYSVNIGTVSLTVNPSTLPAPIVGRAYSQTVSATGGTAPYTFSVVSGALPAGLALNASTGAITGTPTSSVTASFTIQALDVNGNIGARAYTLTTRADPALDPEVQGLVSAQVATAQRFARAQIDNLSQHLASLHDGFNPCSFNFGMGLPIDRSAPQPLKFEGYDAYGRQVYSQPPVAARPGNQECDSSVAAWTAGSIQSGSMNLHDTSTTNQFLTGGITGGLDWRVSNRLIIGAAFGYGSDRSDIGANGTRSNATSFSGNLYASLRLLDPFFLDLAGGYGSLEFDNRRFVTGEGSFATGKRSGSFWFGSATASVELGQDAYKFAPYVRADFLSATFKGYSESGATAQLLTFDDMKGSATSVSIGLRGSIDVPMSFGVLTPNARIEYRQTSQSQFNQSMYYSDLGSATSSAFAVVPSAQSMTTMTLGLRMRAAGGLTVDLEYGYAFGADAYKAQSIKASLRVPF